MAVRVRDFMTALFDGVDGHVDIRTLRPVEQAFVCVGDWEGLEAFVKPRRNRDCYLGVAARVTSGDGSLANCGALGGRRSMTPGHCGEFRPSG